VAGLDDLAVQLEAVRQRLQAEADGALSRRLVAAIGKAVEPLAKDVRDGLPSHLPNRYAEVIAGELDIFRRTWSDPEGARVVVYARTTGDGKRRIGRLDSGVLWHPLFGRYERRDPRNRWFEMTEPHVRPGWWSGPVEDAAPRVRDEIQKAVDEMIQELVR